MTVQLLRTEPLVPAQHLTCETFEEFDRTFRPRLTRYLRRCHRADRGLDVAEAVQETLTRALVGFDRLDPRRDPWPWLVVVARNVIVDMRRRDRHTVTDEESLTTVEDDALPPDEQVLQDEERALLARALDAVPPAQRTVLTLRIVEERTFEEIAALLGRTENSVRQTLFRGRASLASHFTAMGGRRFGIAPLGILVAALRSLRRGADRATPVTTAALPAAGTVLAASLAICAGLLVQAEPVIASSDITGSTYTTAVTTPDAQAPRATVRSAARTAPVVTKAAPAAEPVAAATQVSTEHAKVSVAKTPLDKGEVYSASVTVTTPVGTLEVESGTENGGATIACRIVTATCG